MNKIRVYKNVSVMLCQEGVRLRNAWLNMLGRDEKPDNIHSAMREYFTHKNKRLNSGRNPRGTECVIGCGDYVIDHDDENG